MICIDRFAHMAAAILISIVSNSYYGMLWGQTHIHLPPEHPIMSLETIEIKMAAVSAKRSIGKTKSTSEKGLFRNTKDNSFPVK